MDIAHRDLRAFAVTEANRFVRSPTPGAITLWGTRRHRLHDYTSVGVRVSKFRDRKKRSVLYSRFNQFGGVGSAGVFRIYALNCTRASMCVFARTGDRAALYRPL